MSEATPPPWVWLVKVSDDDWTEAVVFVEESAAHAFAANGAELAGPFIDARNLPPPLAVPIVDVGPVLLFGSGEARDAAQRVLTAAQLLASGDATVGELMAAARAYGPIADREAGEVTS